MKLVIGNQLIIFKWSKPCNASLGSNLGDSLDMACQSVVTQGGNIEVSQDVEHF